MLYAAGPTLRNRGAPILGVGLPLVPKMCRSADALLVRPLYHGPHTRRSGPSRNPNLLSGWACRVSVLT